MGKIKKAILFFLLSLVIVMIFNFIDHGSIFPEKPSDDLNHTNCPRLLKDAFVEKTRKNNDHFDENAINNFAKSVCDCAKSKSNMALNDAVSYCINNKVEK